jgi:Na+/H+-dicarboxylate symporter
MLSSSPIQTTARLPFHRQLYVQVLAAIALGVLVGYAWPSVGISLKPLGDAFIKLVKMIIAPVIFLTIVTGIAGMRELRAIGRVTAKAFGYFLFFSTLALILGLIVGNLIQPGAGLHIDPATLDSGKVADYAYQAHDQTLTGFLMAIIPSTLVSAIADGDILQVLFVAILFGIALTMIGEKAAPLLLVLGTSSSEAALPSLIEKMERAGCRKSVVGLVVPTGYSFNLDGTNIYMTLAALFIAQATDVHLSLQEQVLLLLVAMISSKGAAAVTGAGFITLAATLSIVPSLPVAGMALILGVDRFMSECRSLTNFIGNAVATIIVSAWEKGLDRERFDAAMANIPLDPTPDMQEVVPD